MSKVVLASNNAGKLKEFSAILSLAGIDMIAQGELGVPEADEPYSTFLENALTKARHASRITGLPALADDSGLCVTALDGAPGVLSARFASLSGGEKSDLANNTHLVNLLATVRDRSACYVAVLVYLRSADDPMPIIAQGTWWGEIIDVPKGANGFGYDAHFYVPELAKTVAELDPAVKNRCSHRAQALKELLQALRNSTDPT
ncbi:RdgB/HAM1 family non-canonical purine NTP pyrophosphatase [Candidimonas sp. SYP-B2681]|uniref:RdgB/HAM1 family non-canonical purine NTP pyrophosphatase n=1 Tax=Candidimonas sp. SYP-B2681 TaxID=2497686 RepID=UPI000F8914CF|nr:RdgB/HAM1 family non-canonical purine NTP pyrophosphatase [Candidimonas sp. SYP-B2681]RTZ48198.1 RdgB/HAM1 family non-canonical purine NTP pyrophosphatase [Candidimonas sp. SYP-B2681]